MLLSIIIPHYNLEEWLLRRCLDSIFRQPLHYILYEVIIIDDGSDISPQPVIDSYGKKNLILLTQPHLKQGAARNTGLKHAKGDYILFMDADDYLYENTIPLLLDKMKRSQCDILTFKHNKCYSVKEEKINQPLAIEFSSPFDGNSYMNSHSVYGAPWHYIFKKSLCEENHIQFAEGVYLEDETFTTLLHFKAKQIITTNLITYAYYQRSESTVQNKQPEHRELLITHHLNIIIELQNVYLSISDKSLATGLYRKIIFLTVDFIIRILREKNPRKYLRHYLPILTQKHLYPLPNEEYAGKYKFFKHLANHTTGLYILRFLLKIYTIK